MKTIYQEIQQLLKNGLAKRLDIDQSAITFTTEQNPGEAIKGYNTKGTRETIFIPDKYMELANANSAQEFLGWLKNQNT